VATAALAEALSRHADGPRVLILRDYHAENLLWLADRQGLAAVGLLDFQLAQLGQPGYDLVSLTQDARRDVAPGTEAAMLRHFAGRTGRPMAGLKAAQAVLGAQRALRILGVFARLARSDGKTAYLSLMPRVWGQLQANLARPELAGLSRHLAPLLPPPTPAVLDRIRAACPTP
jgi:aminoglycoside/choline kinase family phosphotransferase